MTAPQPDTDQQEWRPEEILLELLDLCDIVDRYAPAYRYLSSRMVRAAITGERRR